LESSVADLPQHAQVVIIGGGIVGCSVAYHLTLRGCTDVVLLERKQLTCGTTWHAAGLVGQLRATHNLTRLAQYTAELYTTLEDETGQATGFRQTGSLAVATNAGRFEELKRGASMARCFGLEVSVLSPGQAAEMWPLLETTDLVGAVHLPKDGQTVNRRGMLTPDRRPKHAETQSESGSCDRRTSDVRKSFAQTWFGAELLLASEFDALRSANAIPTAARALATLWCLRTCRCRHIFTP
jgi:hypothetical protein